MSCSVASVQELSQIWPVSLTNVEKAAGPELHATEPSPLTARIESPVWHPPLTRRCTTAPSSVASLMSKPVSELVATSEVPTAPGEISLAPTVRSASLVDPKQMPGKEQFSSDGMALGARSIPLMLLFL